MMHPACMCSRPFVIISADIVWMKYPDVVINCSALQPFDSERARVLLIEETDAQRYQK